jgi:hypothetical protein
MFNRLKKYALRYELLQNELTRVIKISVRSLGLATGKVVIVRRAK